MSNQKTLPLMTPVHEQGLTTVHAPLLRLVCFSRNSPLGRHCAMSDSELSRALCDAKKAPVHAFPDVRPKMMKVPELSL